MVDGFAFPKAEQYGSNLWISNPMDTGLLNYC